jgi:hypothetical protein
LVCNLCINERNVKFLNGGYFRMDPNGNGKRGLPRLKEIIRRQRQDSDVSFVYC